MTVCDGPSIHHLLVSCTPQDQVETAKVRLGTRIQANASSPRPPVQAAILCLSNSSCGHSSGHLRKVCFHGYIQTRQRNVDKVGRRRKEDETTRRELHHMLHCAIAMHGPLLLSKHGCRGIDKARIRPLIRLQPDATPIETRSSA